MDLDEDLDTHICLKCQTTIIGLENYIVHRRTQCPMMMAKLTSESVKLNTNEEGTVTVVATVVNLEKSLPESSQPSAVLSTVTAADIPPTSIEQLKPDDFFLSLELQSNKTAEKKREPCKVDGVVAVESTVSSNPITAFSSLGSPHLPPDDMVPGQVVDDKMDAVCAYNANEEEEELEEDNDEWPPEGHTGGKWKPGMRPGTLRRNLARFPLQLKKANNPNVVKVKKDKKGPQAIINTALPLTEDRSVQQNTTWHCTPCNQNFAKESALVSHLASPEHWKQSKLHPIHEQLILNHAQALARFSPFQCYVCSFYFNRYDDFMEHWSVEQELHREHVELHKGFQCSICKLEYWTIDEIKFHLEGVSHTKSISNSSPLVVKSANGFRCQQCDWSTMRYTSLQSHLKGRHHKIMALSCTVCMTSFQDQESLTDHLASDEHRSNCHQCSLCPYLGKSLVDLANHNSLAHYPSRRPDASSTTQENGCPMAEASNAENDVEAIKMNEKEIMGDDEEDRPQKLWRLRGRSRRCFYCEQIFNHHNDLKAHIKDEHPESNFQCQACCVSFICESQFKKHENTRLHKCCITDVSDGLPLEGGVEFYCEQCAFRSMTQIGILFHQAMHIGPVESGSASKASDDEDDDDGGETEDDVDGMDDKVEQQNVTENGVEYEVLPISADKVPDNDDGGKEKHSCRQAPKKGHKKYGCPICQKAFTWIRLRVHLNKHTGDKPFVCTMCGTAYAQKASLWSHIRNQHKEKIFACPQCPFRASRHHKLKVHLEIHNERERNFICGVCGAGFFRRYALIHHEKLHTGDKNQKCNFPGCKKSFRCPSELVYHMRVHTGECPFLCDTCGYSAKTRHQLTKHERTHNGIRPFQCPHCSYSASLSPQLKRHMRIHSGSKPYSCPHCNYTCNTQENLRKHVLKSKKHQGLHVYTCPRCDFGCDWSKDMKQHMMEKHGDLAKAFDETSPAFSSTLTGVYNRERDKKLTGNPPIHYVPRTEKRSHQQPKNPTAAPEEPQSNGSEYAQSEFSADGLDLHVSSSDENDDSSVVIVTNSISEPQLEIAAVESVSWVKVDKTKGKTAKKRPAKCVKAKNAILEKRMRRAAKERQANEGAERARVEEQVMALHSLQEDDKDSTQLFHLLQGDSMDRQESEEIALYTIELPVVQQLDGEEGTIVNEEVTGEILSTVISDENDTQQQIQNAIFIPLSSVLSAAPSADGRTLAFIQNPSDHVMVDTPLDTDEQHTLAFIQNPEGEPVMTMEGQDGETVILYTCMPIST